jgi:protein-tyrosine phosphatase
MKSIIFVCLGNICRSPLAEGIASDLNKKYDLNLIVESAGTGAWHVGEAPCENSIRVAQMNGIDISMQRARQVTKEDFSNFDLVIGLDSKNVANLKAMGCKDTKLLGDYGYDGADVPDPYFFDGFEGFEKVYEQIETCVKQLLGVK